MATTEINRAPVMTLWAAVVAERMGFDRDEALTLGRTVAGLNAQSKGRSLGIFKPSEKMGEEARDQAEGEQFTVELLGRAVPAISTPDGVRATSKGKAVQPPKVQDYLERRFGAALPEVRAALEELAAAFRAEELAERAYGLYVEFRPEVPKGKRGWGAKGPLDTDRIRSLADSSQSASRLFAHDPDESASPTR
jgi:hypothetical protein